MPPGKANLLAALRADPATPRTQPQLIDWIVSTRHGLPLKRTTASEYLNELAKDGYADCIDQGPGRAKLWYLAEGVSDDASASLPTGGLTPAADPSSASSLYSDDDGSAGELTPDDDLLTAGWPEGSIGAEANR